MAGHKGYAVAFMMDILSGVLTGSKSGKGVHGPYEADKRSGCGHMFIAIDIATLGTIEGFQSKVDDLVNEVKAAPLAQGFNDVFYPGELEDRHEASVAADGSITLPNQTWDDLQKLALETGIRLG